MNDPIKNILIGLFVFAAGILVVFVILFLHPTVGDDAQTLRVRFANIDKVSVGTRVTYGGKPVGEVVEIRDIEDQKDARKAGKDGFVYIYELVLQLDSKVNTYNTDQVSLRTSGC
jgi:phospholipid/cholesterol/gamma-HCH transport system substrate-binding protein